MPEGDGVKRGEEVVVCGKTPLGERAGMVAAIFEYAVAGDG
jgi:hypothetical protein